MKLLVRVVEYLKDPALVRRIQEYCGIKVISEVKKEEDDKVKDDKVTSTINGAIKRLATQPITKRSIRTKQPGMGLQPDTSPLSSPGSPPPMDFPDVIVETYPMIDIYFKLASELGYEPFYIALFGLFSWNIDMLPFRHMVMLWSFSMYVGQALKCIVKWPRPAAPPAIRLEVNPKMEQEYGFPSTHAVVSTTIPIYLVYMTSWRYETFFYKMIFIALLWWMSVCFSRLYLGIHCIMDIIGGVIISFLMLVVTLPFLDQLDYFIFHGGPTTSIIALLLVILMIYVYPVEKWRWTSDRGDTAAILGTALGVIFSFNAHGPYPDDMDPGPFQASFPTFHGMGMGLLRWIIGVSLVLPIRFIMKLLCFRLLPAIVPTHGESNMYKIPLILIPYKLITYSSIVLTAVVLSHVVFDLCGISRWD